MSNSTNSCTKRNYDYYRRFFQLKSKYYHNLSYYSNVNALENYYDISDSKVPIDITKRNNSSLCFPSKLKMKSDAIIGPSGAKLTKQQQWAVVAKGRKLC